MSTEGWQLIGFLRSFQVTIIAFIILTIVLIVSAWIVTRIMRTNFEAKVLNHQGDNRENAIEFEFYRKITWCTTFGLIIVTAVFVIIHAMSVVSSNRTPRSDIDKSAVYERMDSHTK